MVADELANSEQIDADSILEWRISPDRLNGELADFLDRVWDAAETAGRAERKARMAGT